MRTLKATAHWGAWVKTRARFVGFSRDGDLASSIGCSRERLSRWVQHATPPRMFKGFDRRLALALRTDHDTLFVHWAKTDATQSPLLAVANPESLRRRARAAVELLDGEELRKLHDLASQLMHRQPATAA